jgi:hypothetical protein
MEMKPRQQIIVALYSHDSYHAVEADHANDADDAGLLSGTAKGNSAGEVPFSNGVVNTNLNSDMLDGYHAGNASGNVPVSNSTYNTDLFAERSDEINWSRCVTRTRSCVDSDCDAVVNGVYCSDATCSAGEFRVSGGCNQLPIGGYSFSYPYSTNKWRCGFTGGQTKTSYVICCPND